MDADRLAGKSWWVIKSSTRYRLTRSGGLRRAGTEKIAYGPFETYQDAKEWDDWKGVMGKICHGEEGARIIRVKEKNASS